MKKLFFDEDSKSVGIFALSAFVSKIETFCDFAHTNCTGKKIVKFSESKNFLSHIPSKPNLSDAVFDAKSESEIRFAVGCFVQKLQPIFDHQH